MVLFTFPAQGEVQIPRHAPSLWRRGRLRDVAPRGSSGCHGGLCSQDGLPSPGEDAQTRCGIRGHGGVSALRSDRSFVSHAQTAMPHPTLGWHLPSAKHCRYAVANSILFSQLLQSRVILKRREFVFSRCSRSQTKTRESSPMKGLCLLPIKQIPLFTN